MSLKKGLGVPVLILAGLALIMAAANTIGHAEGPKTPEQQLVIAFGIGIGIFAVFGAGLLAAWPNRKPQQS